jgi:hypothetical protein
MKHATIRSACIEAGGSSRFKEHCGKRFRIKLRPECNTVRLEENITTAEVTYFSSGSNVP